jgi:hypothetical protein
MTRESGFDSQQEQEIFLPIMSRPALGPTQRPIQWVVGTLSLGAKWSGHEADHSHPPNAKVEDDAAIPSLHQRSSWHGA